MYDAIVVGARCAGSPTAMLLARKGYRVLLLDRSSFPSDIMSTHYIQPPGIESLKRWNLLDQVVATGCPLIRSLRFDIGPIALEGFPICPDGIEFACAPRRTVLDEILVDAAVEAGAELRENFSVRELLFEDDRVVGIRGRDANSTIVAERARVVIGADGTHSFVARSVNAPEYEVRPAPACGYFAYFSGISGDQLEWYPRRNDRRLVALIPTNGGHVVIVMAPNETFPTFRNDIEGNFFAALSLVPGLVERVRAAKRDERFLGEGDQPNLFRRPHGPGWALVGDAGYYKDPITGQGIADAFRDAELLASALDSSFSGAQPLETTLASYEAARNRAVMPMYNYTYDMACLTPAPPEFIALIAAVARTPREIPRLLGTFAGTVSIPEFFSPENAARIIAGAQSSEVAHA
jgi:2-polyprenyl-6-methoxyphenol hydroxylase-like FAD-dependent oxidoreductase